MDHGLASMYLWQRWCLGGLLDSKAGMGAAGAADGAAHLCDSGDGGGVGDLRADSGDGHAGDVAVSAATHPCCGALACNLRLMHAVPGAPRTALVSLQYIVYVGWVLSVANAASYVERDVQCRGYKYY